MTMIGKDVPLSDRRGRGKNSWERPAARQLKVTRDLRALWDNETEEKGRQPLAPGRKCKGDKSREFLSAVESHALNERAKSNVTNSIFELDGLRSSLECWEEGGGLLICGLVKFFHEPCGAFLIHDPCGLYELHQLWIWRPRRAYLWD